MKINSSAGFQNVVSNKVDILVQNELVDKREHQKVVDETHQNAVQGVMLATAVCNSSNAVSESVNQNWDLMPKPSMS